MPGFGDDRFGFGTFGNADWSYTVLWEKWPERLRALATSRGGLLEPFTMAVLPIFDRLIERTNEFSRVWCPWTVSLGDSLVPPVFKDGISSGFWFSGGAEVKDSVTVTLFGETDSPQWAKWYIFEKGSVYKDTLGRKFVVKAVRQGFGPGYEKNGVTYSRLWEVDVECSDVSQISVSTVPAGTGHSWYSQNGMLDHLARTVGSKPVPELVGGRQRSLVGRSHDLVRLKGSSEGIKAFASAHGCEADVDGLYWLSKSALERVNPAIVRVGVQRFDKYPLAWGDGAKTIVSSTGGVGSVCRYLRDDEDYRGDIVPAAPGSWGNLYIYYGITSSLGIEKWYTLRDYAGGILKPYGVQTSVTVSGSVDYVTGAVTIYGYDLSAGYVLRPFLRGEPVAVSFERYGQYAPIVGGMPRFDEIPAEHAVADTTCGESPRVFAVTIGAVASPAPPFDSVSVHEFDIVLAGETVQYPVIPEHGTAYGAWGRVAGTWTIVDFAGNEFYVEQVKRPALGPVASVSIRVAGTIAPVAGVASLTYVCPTSEVLGGASNKVWMSVVMSDPSAFVGGAINYSVPLLTRIGEVQNIHEENAKPDPLTP